MYVSLSSKKPLVLLNSFFSSLPFHWNYLLKCVLFSIGVTNTLWLAAGKCRQLFVHICEPTILNTVLVFVFINIQASINRSDIFQFLQAKIPPMPLRMNPMCFQCDQLILQMKSIYAGCMSQILIHFTLHIWHTVSLGTFLFKKCQTEVWEGGS